jgi:hypothetical protein
MRAVFPLFAVVLALAVAPASAQSVISAKSGLVSYIQGQVFLGDQSVEITPNTTKFPEMKENEVLRTEDGLAEVLLPPGFTLRVGEKSSFRMITNRLIDTRIELLTGSAIVDALETPKDVAVTVVLKGGTISIAKAGHYRLDAEPARLRVFAGLANVEMGGQNFAVAGGKMLSMEGQSTSVEKFDKNETDALENWSHRRAELTAMANVSAARRGGCSNSLYNGGSSGCWSWNPYFGLYTYIPLTGRYCDWTGYCYYSPNAAYRLFYHPPAPTYNPGYGGSGGYYPSMGATSSGYSGAMASSPAASSSPSVGASSGSSAASSAGASSVGHGSAGGGGRGH